MCLISLRSCVMPQMLSLLHVLNSACLWKSRSIMQSDLIKPVAVSLLNWWTNRTDCYLNKLLTGKSVFGLDTFISEGETYSRTEWVSKEQFVTQFRMFQFFLILFSFESYTLLEMFGAVYEAECTLICELFYDNVWGSSDCEWVGS